MHGTGGRSPSRGDHNYAQHVRGKRSGSDTQAKSPPLKPRGRGGRSQGNRGMYDQLNMASLMILQGEPRLSGRQRKGGGGSQGGGDFNTTSNTQSFSGGKGS